MTHNVHPGLEALLVPIDSLQLDPRNARRHPPRNLEQIKLSLQTYGQRKNIVIREGIVTAGNGVLIAARELGWSHIAALIIDEPASMSQPR